MKNTIAPTSCGILVVLLIAFSCCKCRNNLQTDSRSSGLNASEAYSTNGENQDVDTLTHIDDWKLYGYNEIVNIFKLSDKGCSRNEVRIKIENKNTAIATCYSLNPLCSDVYVVDDYSMHLNTVAGDIHIGIQTEGSERYLQYRVNGKEYRIDKDELISMLPGENVDYSNDELYGCFFLGASKDVFLFELTMFIPDTDVGEDYFLFIYPQRRELLPFFRPLDESE